MTKKRFYLNTFIILIISVLTGCGSGDGNQKLAIKGSITLNGVPLKSGAITFIPMEQGVSVGATIANGSYLVDTTDGASPGEYKVEIDSSQPSGNKVQSTVGETMEDEYTNIIPANYNRNSTLKVMLKSDSKNKHDFDLKSK